MTHLDPVVLTDEEQEECQQTIRRFTQSDEGRWVVTKESAESFQRGIIAHCLMGRAERFPIAAGGCSFHITFHVTYYSPEQTLDDDLVERACISSAKACAIYPLPIYSFDFGCILYQVGKMEEAKVVFSTFLSGLEQGESEPMMQIWQKQRNVQASAQLARELIQ